VCVFYIQNFFTLFNNRIRRKERGGGRGRGRGRERGTKYPIGRQINA